MQVLYYVTAFFNLLGWLKICRIIWLHTDCTCCYLLLNWLFLWLIRLLRLLNDAINPGFATGRENYGCCLETPQRACIICLSLAHCEYIYTRTYCTPAHSLHRHLHKGCMYIDRHRHTHNHKIHTCTTSWVPGANRGQSGHCVLETFGQCPLKSYYHSYSFILTQEEPNSLYRYPQTLFLSLCHSSIHLFFCSLHYSRGQQ